MNSCSVLSDVVRGCDRNDVVRCVIRRQRRTCALI